MRAKSFTPIFFALGFYAVATLAIAGCAAWDAFGHNAAPIARAVLGAVEAHACAIHAAAGVLEDDPRAVAIHASGAAVDALARPATREEIHALAIAIAAFEGAAAALPGGAP